MSSNRFFGLRARLVLLLALIIVPVFALLLHNAVETRKTQTLHTQALALRLARLVMLEQRELIAGARQLLPSLAQLPSVRATDGGPACQRELVRQLEQYPYYANFGVSGRDGVMRCSGLPMPSPVHIEDRDYFRGAINNDEFTIGGYQIGRITGKSAINLGYPLRDAKGRVDGVIFAALDLAWLGRKLRDVALPAGTTITIFDVRGTVLTHIPNPAEWFGRSIADVPFVRLILERGAEGIAESTDVEGVQRLFAFTPLDASRRAYVSVGIPRNVAYAEVDARFKQDLLALSLIVLVVISVGWTGSNAFVLRPLSVLTLTSERLGRGDLGARTELRHRSKEFSQLAQTFDRMAASLQQREQATQRQDQELKRINRALQTLSGGNHALVRTQDEAALLQEMCRVAVELGGYRMVWVGFAQDDAEKTVLPMAWAGMDGAVADRLRISWDDTERGLGPTGIAIRTGQPCTVHGLQTDPRYQPWHALAREQGIDSAVSLPLQVDDAVIGAFTLYSEDRQAFDAPELDLLSEMAGDLAYGICTLRTGIQHAAAQATIQRMAYYDELTDLPNHTSLEEFLERCAARESLPQQRLALLLFDLARLRDINDTLGFEAGNQVMQETASRLTRACPEGGYVARMRGDEFAMLLPGADLAQAEQMTQSILKLLNQPFSIDGFSLVLRVNAGIVLCPEHARDAEHLLRHADVAMQLAKTTGNGYAVYSPALDADKKRHLALAADLNRALEDGGLELYFQPKVSMVRGRVIGFEALTRWSHPTHGWISPDEFIPLAERTGMIRALSDWVLETTLRQLHAWGQAGIRLPVAVNLSAHNLQDPLLLDKVEALCASWALEPGLLEMEITESAMMADPAGALAVLLRLRALGIPLYIDDFGTGYSSLSYLKKLPVTALKIDKSFIDDMLDDAESESIVRSTITLAHELGLSVVAEGVEDAAVWARLRAHGCDAAQGYYMGRPMPVAQVEAWLQESPWGIGKG
ncbi:MAG: EAL domain-containing protein [Gammaproteobacteria bacterium]|nr:EAL domain-containing protein [Gammaproteobacteria bacterium]